MEIERGVDRNKDIVGGRGRERDRWMYGWLNGWMNGRMANYII